jgi:hypothetical protein
MSSGGISVVSGMLPAVATVESDEAAVRHWLRLCRHILQK